MKHSIRRILAALCLCLSALVMLAASACAEPQVEAARFIFVGTQDDADCAILFSRSYCVMVDTGEYVDAAHILALLDEYGVDKIDCMILTHPDKDHVGGAAAIAETVPVEQVIVPDYKGDKSSYVATREKLDELNVTVLTLKTKRSFDFGDLSVEIYPPAKEKYNSENNYSLITLVRHGSVSVLLTGDAKRKRLSELDARQFGRPDIYKVPYHGRDVKTGDEWIETLNPLYAVVTAKEAGEETSAALKAAGSRVLYTVPLNDIVFVSDGKEVSLEDAA